MDITTALSLVPGDIVHRLRGAAPIRVRRIEVLSAWGQVTNVIIHGRSSTDPTDSTDIEIWV